MLLSSKSSSDQVMASLFKTTLVIAFVACSEPLHGAFAHEVAEALALCHVVYLVTASIVTPLWAPHSSGSEKM